ncbi:hypothetical protein ES288_A11G336100v1 [Gossypium darwinii]|uniref:Uncharacterized protein n=1 Tax=Gossypium darwinii TaxID=34276 RepID=A0A5D2ERY4_GOSDA|nr:hypothetical protein ES288_A11G336100v1 [Gossypium darwinii]
MRYSNVKQLWEGKQDLGNLKVIRLHHSKNLVRIPDLSSATNLEKINLRWCFNLIELPSSLQHLEKLTLLNFSFCKNLRSLPSFYKATSLTKLYLSGCSNLFSIGEVSPNVTKLCLEGIAIEELPSSIECLSNLRVFYLWGCRRLKSLPSSIHKLKSLEYFDLQGCSRLEIFPEIMDTMERLRVLDLSGTALKGLPSSIDNLVGLEDLRLNYCEDLVCLPKSFYKLESLENFNLGNCSILETFPEILDTMEEMYKLDLSGTALKELPSSITNLIGLKDLRLNNCQNLICLPNSFYKLKSLELFSLEGCSRLEIFPEIMETMERLYELDLSGTALKELPSSIANLIGLKYLGLNNCENLVCLPDSFYKLKSLEIFNVKGCSRLEIFPEIMDTMERLYELDLIGTALKELPSSIGNLISLKDFRLNNCENLIYLPNSFYKLQSLEKFNLKGCSRLEIFPEIMDSLYELDLSRTVLKELPSSIDNLIGLKDLRLNNCENLVCSNSNLIVKNLFTADGGRPVNQKDLNGLSSLHKLDLSESNLENLPTTIKQFPLHELILRNCKRLKSLPELPPSLVYLDAYDCTSLKDISSIKKLFEQELFCEDGSNRFLQLKFWNCFKLGEKGVGNDIDADDSTFLEEVSSIKKVLKQAVFCKPLVWLFTNCFQLVQKAVSSAKTPKLEMPFEHMVTLLKDYHQAPPESKKRACIITCVPGSEIPEWFDFKSLGSSINIQLPSEWCSNNSWINFPCFVASAVVSFPDSSYSGRGFGIRCECHLKSCNGDNHCFSCSSSFSFGSRLSDHVFLLYDGFKVREIVKIEASNNRIYNVASFHFYIEGWGSLQCEVKQCGIHLLFPN